MCHKAIKLLDYFFVLRPTLFYPVWTISLAGLWAQSRFGGEVPLLRSDSLAHPAGPAVTEPVTTAPVTTGPLMSGPAVIAALGLFTLVMGSIFLLNQINDVESDRHNDKLFLIANEEIPAGRAYFELFLLVAFSIGTALLLWIDLAVIMLAAFLVMGWLYSCQPFALKDRPVGGLVVNIIGGFMVFLFGWTLGGEPGLATFIHATPYVFAVTAVYLYTTIPDTEGDRAADKVTVAVRYGTPKIILAGLAGDICAIVSGLLLRDWVAAVPAALAFPFFLRTAVKKTAAEALRTNKYAVLFLSLAVCIRFPLYFPLACALFFFAKWYYKKRFNIIYPGFRN
jgi:4-hydroxybenzoate polyprenyltransferase